MDRPTVTSDGKPLSSSFVRIKTLLVSTSLDFHYTLSV